MAFISTYLAVAKFKGYDAYLRFPDSTSLRWNGLPQFGSEMIFPLDRSCKESNSKCINTASEPCRISATQQGMHTKHGLTS